MQSQKGTIFDIITEQYVGRITLLEVLVHDIKCEIMIKMMILTDWDKHRGDVIRVDTHIRMLEMNGFIFRDPALICHKMALKEKTCDVLYDKLYSTEHEWPLLIIANGF